MITLGQAIRVLICGDRPKYPTKADLLAAIIQAFEPETDRECSRQHLGATGNLTRPERVSAPELSEEELDKLDPNRHKPAINPKTLPDGHWMKPVAPNKRLEHRVIELLDLLKGSDINLRKQEKKAQKEIVSDTEKVNKRYETVVAPLIEKQQKESASRFAKVKRSLKRGIKELDRRDKIENSKKKTPTRKRKPYLKNKRKK